MKSHTAGNKRSVCSATLTNRCSSTLATLSNKYNSKNSADTGVTNSLYIQGLQCLGSHTAYWLTGMPKGKAVIVNVISSRCMEAY